MKNLEKIKIKKITSGNKKYIELIKTIFDSDKKITNTTKKTIDISNDFIICHNTMTIKDNNNNLIHQFDNMEELSKFNNEIYSCKNKKNYIILLIALLSIILMCALLYKPQVKIENTGTPQTKEEVIKPETNAEEQLLNDLEKILN